mgnify:CR=1 FL=1
MNVQQLLESSNQFKTVSDDAKKLSTKWAQSGLLEGLKGENDKNSIAMLLENQAKQLIVEQSSTGGTNSMTGGGYNSENWAGVALPLVRRVFAEIAAKDFVSVQPMNLPSGLVFYMDFKYGTAQPGFNNTATPAGNPSAPAFQANSVFGVTSGLDQDPTGGLYGSGRFGFSINDVTTTLNASGSAISATASGSISAALTMAADADFDEFNYDSKFTTANSASIAAGHFKKISVPAALLSEADLEGVRGYLISGSTAAKITAYYPQFTKNVNDTTLTFIVSGSITNSGLGETIAIGFQKQPASNSRGDFQDTFCLLYTSDAADE